MQKEIKINKWIKEIIIKDMVHRYWIMLVIWNKQGLKRYIEDEWLTDIVYSDSDTLWQTIFIHNDCIVIIDEDNLSLQVLLHEIQHAIMMQANRLWYLPNDWQERFCYTIEYIFNELISVWLINVSINKLPPQ